MGSLDREGGRGRKGREGRGSAGQEREEREVRGNHQIFTRQTHGVFQNVRHDGACQPTSAESLDHLGDLRTWQIMSSDYKRMGATLLWVGSLADLKKIS